MSTLRPLAPFALAWLAACSLEREGLTLNPASAPNSYECACECVGDASAVGARAATAGDDAAEVLATGAVTSTGAVLDLGTAQAIGLRFPNVSIPTGVIITAAAVQLTSAEAGAGEAHLVLRGQAADDTAPFTAAPGDVSSRALTAAAIPWSPAAWGLAGEAGEAQRTPDLSPVLQEIVDRPGWELGNAVTIVVSGAGSRAARAADAAPGQAAVLSVRYQENAVAMSVPVCMSAALNPNFGHAVPADRDLDADCQNRLENTLAGMALACGYPGLCDCDLIAGSARFADPCNAPCGEVELAADCSNFDPEAGIVEATHAPGDVPVCTPHSPLAAVVFGKHSLCEVSGDATIEVDGQSRAPLADGFLELVGEPCPGASCAIGLTYELDLEDVSFTDLWGSETFTDLGAVGRTAPWGAAMVAPTGLGAFAPGSTVSSGRGRRGAEDLGVVAANPDVLVLGVDWVTSPACSLSGALAGVSVDPAARRCEGAGPDARDGCATDADCAGAPGCGDTGCKCLPLPATQMSLRLALQGTLTNQPPRADAGPDHSVECSAPGSAVVGLTGAGSDPDGNLTSLTWRVGRRAGPAVDALVAQPLGSATSYFLRAIDSVGQADEDAVAVQVVDTTVPRVACNTPANVAPLGPPISFTATATDVCDADVVPTLTFLSCFRLGRNGRVVNKSSACGVVIRGNRITLTPSGGVGDHIVWEAQAADDSGNTSSAICEVVVAELEGGSAR